MKLNKIATLGFSLLLLGGVSQITFAPLPVRAESTTAQTQQDMAVLDAGQFVTSEGQNSPTTGSALIIEMNGRQFVQLSRDFSTASGPDVKVILYENSDVPVSIEGTGDYVTLGLLDGFEGRQIFEIPEGVDVSRFNSVGIWCEQFDVTFGYASL